MVNKQKLFEDLCKEVNECTTCQNIMFSPHLEESNRFIHDEKIEGKIYVNRWNLWQGSLDADIMVIGQDYGVCDGKFMTDKSLMNLFSSSFGFDITKCNTRLFFTNISNCYRKNKSTGSFNTGCLAVCSNKYIGRLINIISPKIIIVLGQETFNALQFCDKAKLICENPSEFKESDDYATIINHRYSMIFDIGLKVAVFPVYHPGSMGQRNRNASLQREDWNKISDFYERTIESNNNHAKHPVYHHNMFGPSCEIASLNNQDDFKIYCHLEQSVCIPSKCDVCRYFSGDEEGKGKCCVWKEYYDDVESDSYPVQFGEAYLELERVKKIKEREIKTTGSSHKYDKYRESFISTIKAEQAKPNIYTSENCVLLPDDDDNYVHEYLNKDDKNKK